MSLPKSSCWSLITSSSAVTAHHNLGIPLQGLSSENVSHIVELNSLQQFSVLWGFKELVRTSTGDCRLVKVHRYLVTTQFTCLEQSLGRGNPVSHNAALHPTSPCDGKYLSHESDFISFLRHLDIYLISNVSNDLFNQQIFVEHFLHAKQCAMSEVVKSNKAWFLLT